MSVAITRSSKRPDRPTLSPEKGAELVGLLLVSIAVLLACSFASFHPSDPSLFHHVQQAARSRNWIGAAGAQTAALAFGFFGVTCFVLPLFLAVAGWRRLRRHGAPRVVGRGCGAVLLLAALPGLCQAAVGGLAWRGQTIPAGGAFGGALVELLEERLNLAGALVVLAAATAIGLALVVQSTLGQLLLSWRLRLRQVWQDHLLARARRRERREKERARRRVITKHLQRVVEEKQEKQKKEEQGPLLAAQPARRAPPPASPIGGQAAGPIDLPLWPHDPTTAVHPLQSARPLRPARIAEQRGEAAAFALRRPAAAFEMEEPPEPPERLDLDLPARAREPGPERGRQTLSAAGGTVRGAAGAVAPQKPLPFVGEVKPGALPPVNLLQLSDGRTALDEAELVRLGEVIRSRCAEFGVEGTIEAISPGPVITVFEFQPAPGVKVSHIVNLQDDLALALKAESVRIDRMPGRSTLGLEVPNRDRSVIRLGNLIADERFRKSPSVLTVALGTTIYGEPYYADLTTMPHLLVAGATGSGKSVGLQSMITSILYKATREEVQFIFIDPKRIELGVYADIPHLKAEVVVDPKKAANALRWAVAEMERRYRLLAEVHVRSIAYYNRAICDPETRRRLALSDETESAFSAEDWKPLPYYVVIIDELADLMMVSSADVETSIARLAQMARAVGIHLIVATQRPSVDVLTGTIKANFPCRIAYATASRHDSRTILDQIGSEKLLGRGDMLMMPPGSSRVIRLHGAYVSEQETASLVRWLKKQGRPELDPEVLRAPAEGEGWGSDGADSDDELYDEAARLVVAERQASASFLQRRMRIGFSRAARLIDIMERDGLLGPPQGSKPREVLVKPDYFTEIGEDSGAGLPED
ncbi:MAG TPA: DNA translocase FtsK 4TM domain-containing protein [Thermoanaerobaculia bacterium]|nr:DNA translocase FtsK 4TM domain-containing protein [Thermoanaerobaculia bacterium]